MFGLFSKDRSLKRAMDKVSNQHAQSPDRWAAMEKLGKAGTEDALFALCKRFSFKYDKTIEDAQEKEWVVDAVARKGDAALPALRRYMASASTLHYPLVILGKIAPPPTTVLDIVDEILATEPPGYTRDPERRTDVIAWLGEWEAGDAAEVAKRIIPYLADFDENVRYKAVDSIALKPHESAAEPLLAALTREEEESRRLKVRIAEVLAEQQWDLGDHKTQVSAMFEGGPLAGWKLHHDRLQMPPGRSKAG
jgi:HEAT repeat protein